MLRKLAIAAPLILATVAVLWSGLNLPPPLWIVKYGPWPGCEPTGRTWEIEGVEFVEIGPGICRIGSDWLQDRGHFSGWRFTQGNLIGRVTRPAGLPWGIPARPSWEMPVHHVEFPHGFAIAKTELTVAQFERYALAQDAINVYWEGGADYPVLDLNREDVEGYLSWLAKRSGLLVRLPSESEWECACRAGGSDEYFFGNGEAHLDDYACHAGNAPEYFRVQRVGTRRPNPWGLYDMIGNAWERCADRYHSWYAPLPGWRRRWVPGPAPVDGSAWMDIEGSTGHVVRGGCSMDEPEFLRSASRFDDQSVGVHHLRTPVGFRPAFTPTDR